jgi:hypoxanthine phosphoribosyltransferase
MRNDVPVDGVLTHMGVILLAESVSILISEKEIVARLDALAAQIKNDYAGKTITMVCALKGAVIFMTDLARRLENNVELDFLRVSSYGSTTESSGSVRLDMDLSIDPAGKHILLIEDIVDTGHTVTFLRNYLERDKKPASFKICALLDKPERRVNFDARYDYLGFTIPDEFVVGYGLDYNQRYRNLPYIGVLRLTGDGGIT